jgi:hypothetical protein
MKIVIAICLVVAAGFFQAVSAGSQIIKSSTDAAGTQHPGSVAVTGPATITCTKVTGTNASCYLTGPGIEKQVQKSFKALTISAGTVTLICNGSGSLTCEAQIDVSAAAGKKGQTE